MFGRIASFELRYQLRNPVFWVTFGVFFLIAFGATTLEQVRIATNANIHRNAPMAIATLCGSMSVFAMFALVAFVANAVIRDDETGFGAILRATRIRKFDYLFGRFTGAFVVAALSFAGAPLGILIGSAMPWIDPETLGPFRLGDYAGIYFIVAIPSMFVAGSIFFALATATRSMMACYLGVVALLIAYIVTGAVLNQPSMESIMALADPFGPRALTVTTKYWTAFERNSMLPPLTGVFLYSRLIWIGVSLACLGLTYKIFRFEGKGVAAGRKAAAITGTQSQPMPVQGRIQARFDLAQRLTLLWARTRFEMAAIFKSPAFLVLMVLGWCLAMSGFWWEPKFYGNPAYPVSRAMIAGIIGRFGFINTLIAIYYGSELVWRDRDRRINEIIDSCPIPDWAFMLPKVLAITAVLCATNLIGVAGSVLGQALQGYYHFHLDHYLFWYVLPVTISCAQLAILSILIQTLAPNKYFGWGLMALYMISDIVLNNLGYEHNLYQYAGAPPIPLSDMNGQGQFWIGHYWFQFYWSAFAIFLAVLAHGLWRRGTETRLMPRVWRLPHALAGLTGIVAAIALLAFVTSGVFIFYNTNILNRYETKLDREDFQVEMERKLLPFETLPQPRVTDIVLDVELDPHHLYATTSGHYVVENRTGQKLDEIHLRWNANVEMTQLKVEDAAIKNDYGRLHYRIFTFNQPMQPGEKRMVTFETRFGQTGFKNEGNLTRVVDNGTFVNNGEITPIIGMNRDLLLQDRVIRRKHGLPAELRMAKLEDDSGRANNFLAANADWVNTDITVSTVADQIPIAPGYKISDETKDGRHTVRFKSDAPILPFFSVQSAAYAVKTDKWNDVDLAVYYQPGHEWNINRMIAAMKASLDVYSKAFGPYQFHQARILEFPAYARFAQSFANTIPYSEDAGFITNVDAGQGIDIVTYVTAHEMGHQWWGHQVASAHMQGGTMLVETFAQYSAMLTMEHLYGPDQVRKFLKFELDTYLRSRSSEVIEELPLARVERQPYIYYNKGAVVMYYLKDLVGEDVVDGAMRRLIADYAFKPAPYPSSKDFLRYLREGAGPKYDEAITDLFERITLYDIKVTNAVAKPDGAGKYTVTMDVDAHKFYADGHGKETEADLALDMDVGLFDAEPGSKQFTKANVIHLTKGMIKTGKQTISVTVDRLPKFAGVDPYNKLITRNSDTVLTGVTSGTGS